MISTSGVNDRPSSEDELGFDPYVKALKRFITDRETDPPLTISIDGDWGAGKSTFMRLLRDDLEADGHRTVYFNPWRHDEAETLWAAFMLDFLNDIRSGLSLPRRVNSRKDLYREGLAADSWRIVPFALTTVLSLLVVVVAAGLGWAFGPDAAVAVLGLFGFTGELGGLWTLGASGAGGTLGLVVSVAGLWLGVRRRAVRPIESELERYAVTPRYRGETPLISDVEEDLKRTLGAYVGDERVFVFIDDLDRCSVPQAADLMQALNFLFFDGEPSEEDRLNLVYLVGMDRKMVEAGIEAKYEDLLEHFETGSSSLPSTFPAEGFGRHFIEKFIQVPFLIPRSNADDLQRLVAGNGHPVADWRARRDEFAAPQELADILSDESLPRIERVAGWAARVFDHNPRRMKRFINLYRLRILLAQYVPDIRIRTDEDYPFLSADEGPRLWPDDEFSEYDEKGFWKSESGRSKGVTLEQLGKFVIISIRWPRLLSALTRTPELLGELTEFGIQRKYGEQLQRELNGSTGEPAAGQDGTEREQDPTDIPEELEESLPAGIRVKPELARLLDLLLQGVYPKPDETEAPDRVDPVPLMADLCEVYGFPDGPVERFFEEVDPSSLEEFTDADSRCSMSGVGVQGLLRISPRADLPTESVADDLSIEADMYFDIGNDAYEDGDYDEALFWLQECLDIDRMRGDYSRIVEDFGALGNVALARKDHEAAEEYYREGLETSRLFLDDPQQEAHLLNDLGIVAQRRDDDEAARGYFEEGLAVYRGWKTEQNGVAPRGEADILFNLANIYHREGEYDLARSHLKQSHGIYEDLGEHEDEADALVNLGNVRYDQEEYDDARSYYEEALEIYRDLGERKGEATALYNLGNTEHRQEEYVAARKRLEASIGIFRDFEDREDEANALLNLGNVRFDQNEYDAARDRYEECLDIYSELGERTDEAVVLFNLGNTHLNKDDPDAARNRYEESLDVYRELDERSGEANCLLKLGAVGVWTAEYETAREYCERGIDIYRELGESYGEARGLNTLGWVEFFEGNYPAARERFETAITVIERGTDEGSSEAWSRLDAYSGLGWTAFRQGAYAEAEERFQRAVTINENFDDSQRTIQDYVGLGWVALRRSDYPTARSYFERTHEIGRLTRDENSVAYGLEGLGWVELEGNSPRSAGERFERARDLFEGTADRSGEADARTGLGWVALEEDDYHTAREHFERTRDVGRSTGDPYREASGLWGLGAVDLERDDYEAAGECFTGSLGLFERIGHRRGQAGSHTGLGLVAAYRDDPEEARDRYERADSLRRELGIDLGRSFETLERLVEEFEADA